MYITFTNIHTYISLSIWDLHLYLYPHLYMIYIQVYSSVHDVVYMSNTFTPQICDFSQAQPKTTTEVSEGDEPVLS